MLQIAGYRRNVVEPANFRRAKCLNSGLLFADLSQVPMASGATDSGQEVRLATPHHPSPG